MITRHTPANPTGHGSIHIRPIFDYAEHFDVEADKAAFLKGAEEYRKASRRKPVKPSKPKKKRRPNRYARVDVPCDPDERAEMLRRLREMPHREYLAARQARAMALKLQGFTESAIARFLDVAPSTIKRDLDPEHRAENNARLAAARRANPEANRAAYKRWAERNRERIAAKDRAYRERKKVAA